MTFGIGLGPGMISSKSGGAVALFISGAPTPATQGVAYSWTPSFGGGTSPYTFSVFAGTLPTGYSLNTATGNVHGTDGTVETLTGVTIRITDSAGTPAHVDLTGLSFVVSAPLLLTNSPGTTATVGSAYSYTPTKSGGRGTITYAIANKPSWATFNTSTGALTGTPSGAETDAGINITATDADGRTASTGPFTITVSAPSAGGKLDFSKTANSGLVAVVAF